MELETIKSIFTYIIPFLAWAIGGYITYQITIERFKTRFEEMDDQISQSKTEQEKLKIEHEKAKVRYDEMHGKAQNDMHKIELNLSALRGDIAVTNSNTANIIKQLERLEKK